MCDDCPRARAAREAAERERDAWIETARMHAKNEDWYRGMIDAALAGVPAAFVADDGSVHDTPLRAKFQEILAAEREAHAETRKEINALTNERNAALELAEKRGAAYDMTWREVESLRERLDKEEEERGRQYGLRLEIADEFAGEVAFLRELLVAVIKTGTKDPLLDARLAEELRGHSSGSGYGSGYGYGGGS